MEQTTKGKYTLETLRPLNYSFDHEHTLMEADVSKVNQLVKVIEQSRSEKIPQIGDRLRYVDRYGDFYEHALLERENGDGMSICMNPYVPFVGTAQDNPIWINVSGGPFTKVPSKDLRLVGKVDGFFTVWGHCGAMGNGSVYFTAEVPLWEYTDPNPLYGSFTTETWRKIHIRKSTDEDSRYLYKGSGIAFETESEYRQFLQDYEAMVFPCKSPGYFVIWCFREEQVFVPQEEWEHIDAAIDERRIGWYDEQVKNVKDKERHITTLHRIKS